MTRLLLASVLRAGLVGLVAISFVTTACTGAQSQGDKKKKKKKKKTEDEIVEVQAPPPGELGDACEGAGLFSQGSCAEGLYCGALPDGYCWSVCPCDNGTCVDSAELGELCQKSCAQDMDCRDGYVCDQGWHTCTVVGAVAPKAPVCDTPAGEPEKKTFGKAELVSPSELGKASLMPTAVLGTKGEIYAAFMTSNGFATDNALARVGISAKGAVDVPEELKFSQDNSWYPTMSVDRKGKLYLAYLGFNGGMMPGLDMQVALSTSKDGAAWSDPIGAHDPNDCVDAEPGCLDRPLVVVGPDRDNDKVDNVFVFYYATSSKVTKVVRSTDGGESFASSSLVAHGGYADAKITPKGKIHVVYINMLDDGNPFGDTATSVEWVTSADSGSTFSAPVKISGEDEAVPFYFSRPQILLDVDPKRGGKIYVIYVAGTEDGKWNIMLASSNDQGANWSHVRVNDDDCGANHMVPAAALDPESGKVHVTWFDNRTGQGHLMYTSCNWGKSGDPKCAANERVSDDAFAAYGFSSFTERWLGEYNTLVVADKKLHAMWTETIDADGSPAGRVYYSVGKIK